MLNQARLRELIVKIQNVEYETEEEGDSLINEFRELCSHPRGSDLISSPYGQPEKTPEEIIEIIESYEPLQIAAS